MTKDELKLRAFEIIDNAKKELRDLSEDEAKEIDSIKDEIKSLDEDEKVDEETKSEDTKPEDELEEKELDGNESKPEDEDETSEDDDEVSNDKEEIENNNNSSNQIRKMNKEFRLIKAIRDVANNRSMDEVTKAVANAGAEEMRKSGLSFGGQIQLPLESRTITVAGEHDDVIETEFTNILEPLRAKNVLV